MKKIQINYLDKNNNVIGSYKTNDPWTADERAEWEEWLQDPSVEQYGAPEQWSSFDLIPYTI